MRRHRERDGENLRGRSKNMKQIKKKKNSRLAETQGNSKVSSLEGNAKGLAGSRLERHWAVISDIVSYNL